ncbi:hypothetical protein KSP39_PZI012333 [Platanthera zijinensis]|uniref:TTF-type domain-containing protein n=1 Tax=Platanthera zijinensis TaxID=2320716 RepID=A0AAP0G4F2_9ASPA
MEKFFCKKEACQSSKDSQEIILTSKRSRVEEFKIEDLPSDPGIRQPINSYDANVQESVRRYYLQKGPCQPQLENFPQTEIGKKARRFNKNWFNEFKGWLEYSKEKDAAFCLYCYIFPQRGCEPTFITRGFRNWKDKTVLEKHVGTHTTPHNISRKLCEALMNQKQGIQIAFARQEEQQSIDYRARLCASIDCVRFLLRQGLSFRGHDESKESMNRGNFMELMNFLVSHNDDIKAVALQNAPRNCQLISPKIQKEIVSAIATETTKHIVREIGEDCFAVLVDESRDISTKEQMSVVLRYVKSSGKIMERLLGFVHVADTTALSLKSGIESLFMQYGLSISKLRGQGYDGASNMKGEFRGLKALILSENSCAFYVHCFAHQLQLVLVAVAEGNSDIAELFTLISTVLNVVGGSCKRRDSLRALEVDRVARELGCGELESGQGLNQPLELKRAGDTRWGSHYLTVLNFIRMFSSIVDVLEIVVVDGADGNQRGMASAMLQVVLKFKFAFVIHLMKNILSKTNELSQALQKKDQDIVNAMHFVKLSKLLLLNMRNNEVEWESFIAEVSMFCSKHDIEVPIMNEKFVQPGRSRRNAREITNLHFFRIEIYNAVLDWMLNELNDRFNEVNTELLLCVACLDPKDQFAAYDKQKIIHLAELYPYDFTPIELQLLEGQLDIYICDMRSASLDIFSEVKGISGLLQKIVELKKQDHYQLVFRLLKLVCLLPVATASVERTFSAMKIIKNRLRNRMGDEWMNDCLMTYIEKDVADTITTEEIISRFQSMCQRKFAC